ncbi:DUF5990 family protein [Streptomyces sp. H10-C2]|nr:DUF5990 family protein [Streptomyces sp. H10-C2]
MTQVMVRIVGRDLPGADCGDHQDVHVGMQRGTVQDAVVSADAGEVVFEAPVTLVTAPDGTADFRGPHVQGRRGGRFLYLTWGEQPPGGAFTMFRRAKLHLADIPATDLTAARDGGGCLQGALGLTDASGLPLCASVHPPQVAWSVVPVR